MIAFFIVVVLVVWGITSFYSFAAGFKSGREYQFKHPNDEP